MQPNILEIKLDSLLPKYRVSMRHGFFNSSYQLAQHLFAKFYGWAVWLLTYQLLRNMANKCWVIPAKLVLDPIWERESIFFRNRSHKKTPQPRHPAFYK